MALAFTKMHGLGNDFVVIDVPVTGFEASPGRVKQICDRRFGVGADQLLCVTEPTTPTASVRMEVWNADGSRSEMCGNGLRAVALFWQARSKQKQAEFTVDTEAGLKKVRIQDSEVRVDMGEPKIGARGENLDLDGSLYEFHEISMGNPHAVIFVPDLRSINVAELGRRIETHPRFPTRTNVEFVQVVSPKELEVMVWERGAGLTLACGSGACAAAVAARLQSRVESPMQVHLPGGSLWIEWEGEGQSLTMTGPAREVFRGELADY